MRAQIVTIAFGALALALVPAGLATATTTVAAPTKLSISVPATSVSGRPAAVHVVLRDQTGKPVADATIRLLTTVTFMGTDHQEVVDEARTDASGKAVLMFSPAEAGPAVVTASYEGDTGLAPAKASMTFDVRQPVVAYHPTPVGIQAPWARSYLIIVPFLGVWITYLLVLAQARKVRRAGVRAPSSQGSSR